MYCMYTFVKAVLLNSQTQNNKYDEKYHVESLSQYRLKEKQFSIIRWVQKGGLFHILWKSWIIHYSVFMCVEMIHIVWSLQKRKGL